MAACALPTSASAQGQPIVKSPSFQAGFSLAGSNGYRVSVIARNRKQVTLTVQRGLASASYTASGRASSKRIVADFGSLGRISVRFSGSALRRRSGRSGPSCRGRRVIRQRGAFRGLIRFEGEHRFTVLRARSAKGYFRRSFRRVCKRKRGNGRRHPAPRPLGTEQGPKLLSNILFAESGRGGRVTEFSLSEIEFPLGPRRSERFALAVAVAGTWERRDQVRIARDYLTFEDGDALLASRPGAERTTATIALPKPFSGSAEYQQAPGSPAAWDGSLAIRLPGAGRVPLAGEGFEADLCQAESFKQFVKCLNSRAEEPRTTRLLRSTSSASARSERVDALLARVASSQLSGSQSQAFLDARLSWSR